MECLFEIHFEFLYVGLSWQRRSIEFLEGFGDALGLRARKAPLFEFFDDAGGVDHQGLYSTRQCTTSWVASKSLLAVGFVFANSLPAMAATPDSNISLQRFRYSRTTGSRASGRRLHQRAPNARRSPLTARKLLRRRASERTQGLRGKFYRMTWKRTTRPGAVHSVRRNHCSKLTRIASAFSTKRRRGRELEAATHRRLDPSQMERCVGKPVSGTRCLKSISFRVYGNDLPRHSD